MRPASKPPELALLLNALVAADVRFVVVGSVATLLYGGRVEPGDLDIVPSMDRHNLTRLATVLQDLGATVQDVDRISTWALTPEGEWKWENRPATDEERQALLDWVPNPDQPSSFDYLLNTCLGNLDVVPVIAGEYTDLARRAISVPYADMQVLVAQVSDLLATLTVPRRAKDKERVRFLRSLQH